MELDEVRELLALRLQMLGYELVDVRPGRMEGRRGLEVLIDKPEGVTADDCQQAAEHVGLLLDTVDPIPGRYMLQVSSPGLDRPLRTMEHFERFAGHRVVVKFSTDAPPELGSRMKARLMGVRDGEVVLDGPKGEIAVGLAGIASARLEPEWD